MKKVRIFLTEKWPLLMALLFVAYVVTGQMFMLQVRHYYVYVLLAKVMLFGAAFYALLSRRFFIVKSRVINFYYLGLLASMLSAILSGLSRDNLNAAIFSVVQAAVVWGSVAYFQERLSGGMKLLDVTVRAMKVMCAVHCLYILLQHLAVTFFSVNLNQLLFVSLLGTDYTGLLCDPVYTCTGFTYSQPLLGPMFVIGLLLFNSFYVRALIILAAFLCRSTTSVVGVLFCAGLLFLRSLAEGNFSRKALRKKWRAGKKWKYGVSVLLLAASVYAAFLLGITDKILSEGQLLAEKLITGENGSGKAHFQLFRDWLQIWKQSGWQQILFGYGNNCAGLPLAEICGEIRFPVGTVAECDYADTAISRGLFGLITTYAMFVRVAVKGAAWDSRYPIFAVTLLVMGIGYNIQWPYLMFFLMLMIVSIDRGFDLFERADRV